MLADGGDLGAEAGRPRQDFGAKDGGRIARGNRRFQCRASSGRRLPRGVLGSPAGGSGVGRAFPRRSARIATALAVTVEWFLTDDAKSVSSPDSRRARQPHLTEMCKALSIGKTAIERAELEPGQTEP